MRKFVGGLLVAILTLSLTDCAGSIPNSRNQPKSIRIAYPEPKAVVTSPLTVRGRARGSWFFEGQFELRLLDAQDDIVARGTARATNNWMSEDIVPFNGILSFNNFPRRRKGRLLFIGSNPSGKPSKRKEYSIRVRFR